MNMRVVDLDWDRRILVPRQWSFQSRPAGKKTKKQTWPNITKTKHQFPPSHLHSLLVSCYKAAFTFHTSKCLDLLITHWRVAAAASGIAGKCCNGDRHSHHQEIKRCQYSWKALAQNLVDKDKTVHTSLCWSLNTVCSIKIRQHNVAKTDSKGCKKFILKIPIHSIYFQNVRFFYFI